MNPGACTPRLSAPRPFRPSRTDWAAPSRAGVRRVKSGRRPGFRGKLFEVGRRPAELLPRPVGRLREAGTPGEARGAGLGGSDGLKGSGAARQPSPDRPQSPRAMMFFSTSEVPPAIRVTRASTQARPIPYSFE